MKCRKKLDVDCVVMEEMLFGVRLCIVLQRKKCCLVLDYVLCCKGRNAVRPLDLCCVAREVMP